MCALLFCAVVVFSFSSLVLSFAAYMCVMEYDVTCCYGLLQVAVCCCMTSVAIVIHIVICCIYVCDGV